MNTTFAKALTRNTMFRDANGVFHICRTSEQDTECMLFSGKVCEFGLISAIREVADIECTDDFVPSQAAYLKIAQLVESLADIAGSEFARDYRVISSLVTEHANSLGEEAAVR